jgi:hypothetical protein
MLHIVPHEIQDIKVGYAERYYKVAWDNLYCEKMYNVISRLINEHVIRILHEEEPKIKQVAPLEANETPHQIMSFKSSSSSQKKLFHFKVEGSFNVFIYQDPITRHYASKITMSTIHKGNKHN